MTDGQRGETSMSDSRVEGWSTSRYWTYLRNVLRRGFSRYPNKYEVLKRSKEGRNQYRCAGCGGVFGKKDTSVDHIEPCGPLRTWDDVAPFVDKMFCSLDGLQVLCKTCHDYKSLVDRGMSEEEIASIWFKKLKAKEQKQWLMDAGIEPASNAEKRLKQYRRTL